MTESNRKTMLKTGVILVILLLFCVVMVGTGAASLKDNKVTDDITLSYCIYENDKTKVVTETIKYENFKKFFNSDHVYLIRTVDDLKELAKVTSDKSKDEDEVWRSSAYVLANDIDCSGESNMQSIGTLSAWSTWTFFNGSIWGNGHSIKNFKQEGDNACGLISRAGMYSGSDSGGHLIINNLTMENCYINNTSSHNEGVGAFVGRVDHVGDMLSHCVELIGCHVKHSTILSKNSYTGGLIGQIYSSTAYVSDCSVSNCKIFSTDTKVGGLVGGTDQTVIKKVFTAIVDFINNNNNTVLYGALYLKDDYVTQCKIGSESKNVGGVTGYASIVKLLPTEKLPQGVLVKNCLIESKRGNSGGLFGYTAMVNGGKTSSGIIFKDYYYSVEDSVVIADNTNMGVVVGDIYTDFRNFLDTNYGGGTTKVLVGKNIIVGGTGDITVTPLNPIAYQKKGNYYVSDSSSNNGWKKVDSLFFKNEAGKTIATTYSNFNSDFLESEFKNKSDSISTAGYGSTVVVNLGNYGTETGYGYIDVVSVPVTYCKEVTYYSNEDKSLHTYYGQTRVSGAKGHLLDVPELETKDGVFYDGWYKNRDYTGDKWNSSTDIVTGSTSLYVKGEEKQYTLVYHTNHDSDTTTSVTPYYTEEIELSEDPAGTYPGHKFAGWNTKADGTGITYGEGQTVSRLTDISGTIDLYAQWKESVQPVLSFVMNGHGEQQQPISAVNNRFETLPVPAEDYYTFGGWYMDETCTERFDTGKTYDDDQVVYAKWTEYSYSIAFDSNGGTGSMEVLKEVPYSGYVLLPSNGFTRDNYLFEGWKFNDKIYKEREAVNKLTEVNGGTVTLASQWKPAVITLTFKDTKNLSNVSPQKIITENIFTLPVEPVAIGYTFGGWYEDEACTKEFDFSNTYTSDQVVYAKWTEHTYTIHFDKNSDEATGNMEDMTDILYSSTEKLTKNDFSRSGYTFIGWNTEKDGSGRVYGDCSKISKLTSRDKETITLYAQWDYDSDQEIYLTFNMNGRGDQLKTETYHSGDTFEKKDRVVPTSPGALFVDWYSDSALTNKFVFNEQKDKSATAYAKWEEVEGVYVWDEKNAKYVNVENNDELAKSSLKETVSYDSGTKTLKMNGYHADFAYLPEDNYGAVYSSLDDNLTIELEGQNTIGTGSDASQIALYSQSGSFTITGTGSLAINVKGNTSVPYALGVFSSKDITVRGGNITINADGSAMEMGLFAAEKITISGGCINITLSHKNEKSYAICAKTVEITGGDILNKGGITGIYSSSGNFSMTDGVVTIDDSTYGIAVYGAFTMKGGVVTVTNAKNGIITKQEMNLSEMKSGQVELSGSGNAIIDRSYLEIEENMIVYVGESAETSTLWEGDNINDIVDMYQYVLLKAGNDGSAKTSSSITSFLGEKNGNDFTFDRAVVITKITLPDATYATVINTSGSGWYNCSLSTDGTAGIAYFQVPLDVLDVKGYTVNDVSMLGCTTTYLGTTGTYAKYSAVINGAGSYTIDFEKDASAKAVTETKPVTETPKTEEPVKTVETPVTTPVTTEKPATQTAATSPFPVLGILAGLGIAALFLRRR